MRLALELNPDVVLMDAKMPVMDGIEATERIRAARPEIKIIAITGHHDQPLLGGMIEAGVVAYLSKKSKKDEIGLAIRLAMEGKRYLGSEIADSFYRETAR